MHANIEIFFTSPLTSLTLSLNLYTNMNAPQSSYHSTNSHSVAPSYHQTPHHTTAPHTICIASHSITSHHIVSHHIINIRYLHTPYGLSDLPYIRPRPLSPPFTSPPSYTPPHASFSPICLACYDFISSYVMSIDPI